MLTRAPCFFRSQDWKWVACTMGRFDPSRGATEQAPLKRYRILNYNAMTKSTADRLPSGVTSEEIVRILAKTGAVPTKRVLKAFAEQCALVAFAGFF